MRKDSLPLKILIIEDNPGDYVLVEDFLLEKFDSIKISSSSSFEQAKGHFSPTCDADVILLDLILPDLYGSKLVENIQELCAGVPIIVLTGYTDIELAKQLLSRGVYDFLIKDEITPEILYKTIVYAFERKIFLSGISQSKKLYQDLFNFSPQPMFLYSADTLQIIDVNHAAQNKYGYSKLQFLSMTLKDLRPKDQVEVLMEYLHNHPQRDRSGFAGIFTHCLSNGENIQVEIYSSSIDIENQNVRLVMANDITDKLLHINTIENQNKKLKHIAWTQSHVVRAPLSRMLGIINLIEMESHNASDLPFLLEQLKNSANEVDDIIKDIVGKTKTFNINNTGNNQSADTTSNYLSSTE